jgi:hypothetical protein
MTPSTRILLSDLQRRMHGKPSLLNRFILFLTMTNICLLHHCSILSTLDQLWHRQQPWRRRRWQWRLDHSFISSIKAVFVLKCEKAWGIPGNVLVAYMGVLTFSIVDPIVNAMLKSVTLSNN